MACEMVETYIIYECVRCTLHMCVCVALGFGYVNESRCVSESWLCVQHVHYTLCAYVHSVVSQPATTTSTKSLQFKYKMLKRLLNLTVNAT